MTAPAILFGTTALIVLRLILPSLLPIKLPSVAIPLSSYPLATVVGILLSIALVAAVTEEIAFRGYMQRPMEEAYGIVPAMLIVGIMFWVAHLDHGITWTHLPFQMSASILAGLVVYFTRSLVPAMIAHAAADLTLQPIYFSHRPVQLWNALSARPIWVAPGSHHTFAVLCAVFVVTAGLTAWSILHLARIAGATKPAVEPMEA